MLSDIFVENGLVRHLEEANFTEDLTTTYGDAFTAKNLRNMGLVKTVEVAPVDASPEVILRTREVVEDYALWTKQDNPEALLEYLNEMTSLDATFDA